LGAGCNQIQIPAIQISASSTYAKRLMRPHVTLAA
jgi:hypothetical protein